MIVTATPAEMAQCPQENPDLVPDFWIRTAECVDYDSCVRFQVENQILEFLNQGGPINFAVQRLETADFGETSSFGKLNGFVYQDVTGDSVSDLIFEDFGFPPRVHIFYCEAGIYKLYPQSRGQENLYGDDYLYSVKDMNLDGLPEIVIIDSGGCSGSGCLAVSVIGWNGKGFDNLSEAGIMGPDNYEIRDIDGNGTTEIVLRGDQPGNGTYSLLVPWRLRTDVYSWDGRNFALSSETFSPPAYRFQVIQDADRSVLLGKYDEALLFYQDAIFSNKLDWWSTQRRDYFVAMGPPWHRSRFTPIPSPPPDTSEYPKLAAYAYYRIMLLHIVRGYESDAGTVYQMVLQKFPAGDPGHPYVEMATAFWNEFQASHAMTRACGAAIQYAAGHPEILAPLEGGSVQDHHYKPEDVCPFR